MDALYSEADLGDLTLQIPRSVGGRKNKKTQDTGVASSKSKVIRGLGFETKQVQRFEQLAQHRDVIVLAGERAAAKEETATRCGMLDSFCGTGILAWLRRTRSGTG